MHQLPFEQFGLPFIKQRIHLTIIAPDPTQVSCALDTFVDIKNSVLPIVKRVRSKTILKSRKMKKGMYKINILIVLFVMGIAMTFTAQTPKPFQDLNNGKWGLKTKEGTVLVAPKYDGFRSFRGNYATVILDSKHGLIDTKGNEIFPAEYDNIQVTNDIARLDKNDKIGLSKINPVDGKVTKLTELKFDKVLINPDNSYFVQIENKWGIYNPKGIEVIAPKYDVIDYYDKNFTMVSIFPDGNKYKVKNGLITKEGKTVTPIKYSQIKDFSGDLAQVAENGKLGYINKQGVEIVPAKYDFIEFFNSKNFVRAQIGEKWGYVNRLGKEVIPIKYDEIFDNNYSDGIIYGARLGNKWGFVNLEGVEIVPFIYEAVKGKYMDGLVGAKLNDKWGFIDKTGKEVIPFSYDDVDSFYSGKAKVKNLDARGMGYNEFYINKLGEKIN